MYRMLSELCNTKNSRYFDGKRVLNDGIRTSMVTVYGKVEPEKPRIASSRYQYGLSELQTMDENLC